MSSMAPNRSTRAKTMQRNHLNKSVIIITIGDWINTLSISISITAIHLLECRAIYTVSCLKTLSLWRPIFDAYLIKSLILSWTLIHSTDFQKIVFKPEKIVEFISEVKAIKKMKITKIADTWSGCVQRTLFDFLEVWKTFVNGKHIFNEEFVFHLKITLNVHVVLVKGI